MQPLHNKKLRRQREMCALYLENEPGATPQIVYARDHDFAKTENLYGLFATRKAALERLRMIVETDKLCAALTGLETITTGRACFARQIARCLGACVGAETVQAHHLRLKAALEEMRVVVWPYEGPVGIVEECDGWRQIHLVDHWFYLGSVDYSKRKKQLKRPVKHSFDIDTYKILVRPLLCGELRVEPVAF